MNIEAYKTKREKLAYIMGFAFALGMKHKLAYDANTNNPYWITTENGHHFLIDEEGIIQGGRFKGQSVRGIKQAWERDSVKLSPYLSEIIPSGFKPPANTKQFVNRTNGNYKLAIKDYYDQEYRDRAVKISLPINGKNKTVTAEFARGPFRDEFTGKHEHFYKEKMECMPHVLDVLRNGKLVQIDKKTDHKDIVGFYTFMKTVVINGKRKKVAIDVAETFNGYYVCYNLTAEGIKGWNTKESHFNVKQ